MHGSFENTTYKDHYITLLGRLARAPLEIW